MIDLDLSGSLKSSSKRLKTEESPSVKPEVYITDLTKQCCETCNQSIEEPVRFIQSDDSTWAEINIPNGDEKTYVADIKPHSTKIPEEKKASIRTAQTNNHFPGS